MQVGLVLGAGGLAGEAFHRGVLRALSDAGWDARDADVLVGTSAGSIVAASLRASRSGAALPRPSAAAAAPVDVVAPPRARRLLLGPLRARPVARAMGLLPAGRIATDFLSDGFDRRFRGSWPDRDTWIVAVGRRDGRRVVFGRGDAPPATVGAAVSASCAIPAYFRPVTIGGVQYVDGGVHSPTNADVLRSRALDAVLVSSPMSVRPGAAIRPHLDTPVRLRFHRYLQAELRRLRSVERTLTFEPSGRLAALMGLNLMSAGKIDEIEDMSHSEAAARLRAGEGIDWLTAHGDHRRSGAFVPSS